MSEKNGNWVNTINRIPIPVTISGGVIAMLNLVSCAPSQAEVEKPTEQADTNTSSAAVTEAATSVVPTELTEVPTEAPTQQPTDEPAPTSTQEPTATPIVLLTATPESSEISATYPSTVSVDSLEASNYTTVINDDAWRLMGGTVGRDGYWQIPTLDNNSSQEEIAAVETLTSVLEIYERLKDQYDDQGGNKSINLYLSYDNRGNAEWFSGFTFNTYQEGGYTIVSGFTTPTYDGDPMSEFGAINSGFDGTHTFTFPEGTDELAVVTTNNGSTILVALKSTGVYNDNGRIFVPMYWNDMTQFNSDNATPETWLPIVGADEALASAGTPTPDLETTITPTPEKVVDATATATPAETMSVETGVSYEEALDTYPQFTDALERLDNSSPVNEEKSSIVYYTEGPNGQVQVPLDIETTTFRTNDNGELVATTEHGVELVYLSVVEGWAVEQIDTGSVTVLLTTNMMNAYDDVDKRKADTTPPIPNNVARQAKSVTGIELASSPDSVQWDSTDWDQLITALNYDNFNPVPTEQISTEMTEQLLNNMFLDTFGRLWFERPATSEEITALNNYLNGTANGSDISLIEESPNAENIDFDNRETLSVNTSEGRWDLKSIRIVFDTLPLPGESLINPDVILSSPLHPISFENGEMTLRITSINLDNKPMHTLVTPILWRFLNSNGIENHVIEHADNFYPPVIDNEGNVAVISPLMPVFP